MTNATPKTGFRTSRSPESSNPLGYWTDWTPETTHQRQPRTYAESLSLLPSEGAEMENFRAFARRINSKMPV